MTRKNAQTFVQFCDFTLGLCSGIIVSIRMKENTAGTTSSKFPRLPKELRISDGLPVTLCAGKKGEGVDHDAPGSARRYNWKGLPPSIATNSMLPGLP